MARNRTWVILGGFIATALLSCAFWYSRSRPGPGLSERGTAAYAAGDWDTALQLARERLKATPKDQDAQRLFARASLRLGHEQPARSIYGSLGGPSGMHAEDLYLLGRLLRDKGESEMAEQCWSQGLHEDPTHAPLLLEMAKLDLGFEKLVDAAAFASRLSERPGYEVRGALLLGEVRAAEGDLDAAVACWQGALKRASGAADVPTSSRRLLARALLRLGRPGEARAALASLPGAATDTETAWLLSRAWLQEGDLSQAAHALAIGRAYRDEHPLEGDPAPYVGAARCGECHRAVHQRQQQSLHAKTFVRGADLSNDLLTQSPVAGPADPSHKYTLSRSGEGVQFESMQGDSIYRAIVEYAFGSGHLGVTLVARDEPGRSRECRLSRYVNGTIWDVTTGQPRELPAGGDGLGRVLSAPEVWACIVCHTTDPRTAVTGRGATKSDHGIACERCHGPGGNHLKAIAAGADKFDDLSIAKPARGSAAQVVALCGDCHTLRGGQKVLPEDPRSVRFQAATFTWSRCYTQSNGSLDCLTCHDPHRDTERSASHYDAKCLSCHGRAEAPTNVAVAAADGHILKQRRAQGSPCPVNPVSGCRSCHMPDVRGIIPHSTVTDHYIRVHPEHREQTALPGNEDRSRGNGGAARVSPSVN